MRSSVVPINESTRGGREMDVIKYCRDNSRVINEYILRNGRIEAIKVLRSMFDEQGKRKEHIPDEFTGERLVNPSYLSLLHAKSMVDLVSGNVE
jgi:hypothetical protein